MTIKIGTIEYTVADEQFETDDIKITKTEYHEEQGGYKEPNDVVETVQFEAHTEHGKITGSATARRSGFDTYFVCEDVFIDDNNEIDEISTPDCTIEEEDE